MSVAIMCLILLVSLLATFCVSALRTKFFNFFSVAVSGFVFALAIKLLMDFDPNVSGYQDVAHFRLSTRGGLNLTYIFGVDGISVFFIFLTALLVFRCFIYFWNDPSIKIYGVALLFIELMLILFFAVTDILFLYLAFEGVVLPMFILIGRHGSRERRIRAAFMFALYTMACSAPFALAVMYIYFKLGTFSLELIAASNFTLLEQQYLWLAFFLAFASKIPMFPFHIWLPEAHVEAPTVGSVLLAGVLLKLGVYGFIRLNLNILYEASLFFSPMIYILSIIGIVYASLTALRQTDFKRIVAYSSVAHMSLVTIGLFSFNNIGIEGALIQSLSHGFVASALFFLIGIVYSRYHTRAVYYYGGLVHTMPLFAILFLIFTMANIALPGTSSFVGEFLLLAGTYKQSILVGVIACTGVILSGAYSLWLFNRVVFGNLKGNFILASLDVTNRENYALFPLLILTGFMGIYPSVFLGVFHLSTNFICVA